jgi:hypothetical protein
MNTAAFTHSERAHHRDTGPVLKRVISKAKLIVLTVLLATSTLTRVATQTASTAQAAGYPWGPAWIPYRYYTPYYLDCYYHGYYLQIDNPAYFMDQYDHIPTYPINLAYVWAYCGP